MSVCSGRACARLSCLLLFALALALPASAAPLTPAPVDLDLRLPAADDEFDDADEADAVRSTQAHILSIGSDVRRLHKNAKWRYWVGFPALFVGITLWTGGGTSFGLPNAGSGTSIGLGTGAFVTGVVFLDKANQYDRAATQLLGGARRDPLRERRRALAGFRFGANQEPVGAFGLE